MGFFFNEVKGAKAKAPTRSHIPVEALQKVGCRACPRDKRDLDSPKFAPYGDSKPLLYLLGTAPSLQDDERGMPWKDRIGAEVYSKLRNIRNYTRSGFITQCYDGADAKDDSKIATECCRPRVIEDIERERPLVVAGIGDAPLKWATGLDNAMAWRGELIATRIGKHNCWYYPLATPFYALGDRGSHQNVDVALRIDCQRLIDFIDSDPPPPKIYDKPYDGGIQIITGHEPGDIKKLNEALHKLVEEICAIDLETSGLRVHRENSQLYLAAIGTFDHTVAFPLDHPEGWQTSGQRKQAWELLTWFLAECETKIAHNLAFELEWLAEKVGPEILEQGEWHDTMAMCHSLNERKGTKSLDVQIRKHFGFFLKDQSRVDASRLLEYPIGEALRYNGLDAKWTHKLASRLLPQVTETKAFLLDYERKRRTARTLVRMESQGLPVDFDYVDEWDKKLTQELRQIEQDIKTTPEVRRFTKRYGRTFQPTSSDDVLVLLRDVCGLKEAVQRTETDGRFRWTTDEEALSSISKQDAPSAPLILQHRASAKLLGTYIEPIKSRRIVCPDGKVRTKYSTMEAETGRLASEDPNVQNFPKRKHVEIRGVIYAEDDWIVACDYGQIEFRVVGMASEDENLVRYCWTGYDVHKAWAVRMVEVYPRIKDWIVDEFNVDWDEKGLKVLRQEAKNGWVFPQLFGSTTRSCAERLHLPEHIADDLGAEFWDEFQGAKKWQERILRFYDKNLYVETLGGRRRRGPLSKNQIINHPIQGTACEIVVDGMNAVNDMALHEHDLYLLPRLNVHDDLTYFMPDNDQLLERIDKVAKEMCRPRHSYINVPLLVEVSLGPRWSKLKELGVYRSNVIYNTPNPYA